MSLHCVILYGSQAFHELLELFGLKFPRNFSFSEYCASLSLFHFYRHITQYLTKDSGSQFLNIFPCVPPSSQYSAPLVPTTLASLFYLLTEKHQALFVFYSMSHGLKITQRQKYGVITELNLLFSFFSGIAIRYQPLSNV